MIQYKAYPFLQDNYFPDQKVSSKEKEKEEFYVSTINYIIGKAIAADSANKTEAHVGLEAAKGKVTTQKYLQILLPLTDGQPATNYKVDTFIDNIDFITPIKERYLGEFYRLQTQFLAIVIDDDPVLRRNEDLQVELNTYFQQLFVEKVTQIQAQQTQAEQQGQQAPPQSNLPDVDTFIANFISKWRDKIGELAQHKLELLKNLTKDTQLYAEAFYYWWTTDQVFSYRTIIDGKIVKEIIPPTEYFRVHSGSQLVCDDLMGMRKTKVSIMSILNDYSDLISESDKNYLLRLRDKYITQKGINVPKADMLGRFEGSILEWVRSGIRDYSHDLNITDESLLVDKQHVVLHSYRKIGILTYEHPTEGILQTEVDEDYKLEPEFGDIDIEWEYVPIILEGYLFGDKYTGIYTKIRPCIFQNYDINGKNPKLPYNGVTGLFRYYGSNPVPVRLIPYLVLYRVITKQLISTIRKYRPSILAIAESLLQSSKNHTLTDRMNALHDDNLLLINSDEASVSLLQATREIGNSTIERFIEGLINLRKVIKEEAWEAANMNQERYGDIDTSAGKANTQEAIRRVSIASVPMLEVFNNFRCADYNLDIEYTKLAWINGFQGVILSEEGKPIRISIDGNKHLNETLGIFVVSSIVEQEKLAEYKQLAFSASQNGDFVVASEAIDARNSVTLKNLIRQHDEMTKAFQKEMEVIKGQQQQALQDKISEEAEKQHAREIEKLNIKGEWAVKVAETRNIDEELVDYKPEELALKREKLAAERDKNLRDNDIKERTLEAKKQNKNKI